MLYNNTIGYSNVGVGYQTLFSNTTAYGNVGVGVNALYTNTTGYQNVGVGYYALYSNTIGYSNVGVGASALRSNTTGYQNVGVGFQALYDQTTGINNVALGYNTGRGITTGSNNTIIGSNVTGLTSTLNNTVIIADGSGNQRIYIDNNGNVGIGNTTPNATLLVQGNANVSGNLLPGADNTYNLGSTTFRWANMYTGDLNLSNEGSQGNDIDSTTGSWTIQEGETQLYIINKKTGKRYRFMIEEI